MFVCKQAYVFPRPVPAPPEIRALPVAVVWAYPHLLAHANQNIGCKLGCRTQTQRILPPVEDGGIVEVGESRRGRRGGGQDGQPLSPLK